MAGEYGLNKSGKSFTVYNYNLDTVLGTIYSNEFYVLYAANLSEPQMIRFRSSGGSFIIGYLRDIEWMNIYHGGDWFMPIGAYKKATVYYNGGYRSEYVTTKTAYLYNNSGTQVGSIAAGTRILLNQSGLSGESMPYLIKMYAHYTAGATDAGWMNHDGFLDSGIRSSSMSLSFKGNW